MNSLTQNDIQNILDRVMRDITNQVANIQLCKKDSVLSSNTCTVHTIFEGGCHASLTLCADASLFTRLTQNVMQEEVVAPQDIEDFTKEYFNVICGQVVYHVFKAAHISSRFQIPTFYTGQYLPTERATSQLVLRYTSNCNECAQLIYQIPIFPKERCIDNKKEQVYV